MFAQAATDKPSRFIRVMILPRALTGKSSIQYVNEEDKAKPKTQSYKIYADAPISFDAATQVTQRQWPPSTASRLFRHQGGGGRARARCGAAGKLSGGAGEGLRRPADRQAIQGRPVEPDLSAGDAGAALRAAPQAARQTVAVGACGRPRIPRDPRAACARFPGRRAAGFLRRREYRRHAVLCDGLCRRPRVLGAADAGLESGRAHRGL